MHTVEKFQHYIDKENDIMYSKLYNKNGNIGVRISTDKRDNYRQLSEDESRGLRKALRNADQSLRSRNMHGENVKPYLLNKLDSKGFLHVSGHSNSFVEIATAAGQYEGV